MERIPVPAPEAVQPPLPDRTDTPAVPPEVDPAQLEARLDRLLEARLEALAAKRRQADRQVHLERFTAGHPDFLELQASGVLGAIRGDNPLLDDVGAYLVHRLASERAQTAQALEQARHEAAATAEAATLDRVRTKRLAATLGAGQGGPGRGQGAEPELNTPEQFGGLTHVLASRLEARRKAAGH